MGKSVIKITLIRVDTNKACDKEILPAKDILHFITALKKRSKGMTNVQDRAIMNSPIAKVIQKTKQVGFRIFTVAIKMIQKSNSIAGI